MPLAEPVPDVRSLDLLRSVAELGSIRQAAIRHNISQPAASMRLHTLELTLDLRLLDRSHGRAQLTSAGVAVVRWSEEVLAPLRELLLGTQALRAVGKTNLRVAASMTVAEYLIPGWLQRLRTAHPGLLVSLQMGNSQHCIEVMTRGDADIGFIEGPLAPRGLSSRVVRSDDLVVIVAPSHDWARRSTPVTAKELAVTPLVLREVGSGTREVFETTMRLRGLNDVPLLELGSTTALKSAVESGAGPGILSRLAVQSEVRDGRLTVVTLADISFDRSIRLVWSKERPLGVPAKQLVRLIEEPSTRARQL
jgi:DNA-binding transcriptional LysR family regulator